MASSLTCVLKSGAPAGEAFGRGDVIGLVLDMVELKLTYYKNGKTLGDAFTNLPAGVKLYPPIRLSSRYFFFFFWPLPASFPDRFVFLFFLLTGIPPWVGEMAPCSSCPPTWMSRRRCHHL